jgi:2-dehydro-3-deoxyphosphogluconate aldolase / (4S)-4-hydroxy-2-oxoglutarate aldolase
MPEVIDAIIRLRILPTITLERVEDARPLADALKAGGLPVAEVTFRTAAAEESIRAISEDNDVLLGAGTVLQPEQVDRALSAGAAFVVSPGFNRKVVDRCREVGLPIIPGVSTPTEIEMALDAGIDLVKFFPSEALGGVAMLKAISAPYGMVRFVPTGGVSPQNLSAYLALPSVAAVGGSWMVASDLIKNGRFEEITRLTSEAMAMVRSATP